MALGTTVPNRTPHSLFSYGTQQLISHNQFGSKGVQSSHQIISILELAVLLFAPLS